MEWISTKEKHAPFMKDILFVYKKKVCVGWNEANTVMDEDPCYIMRSTSDGYITAVDGKLVKYWMPFPKPPQEKEKEL